MCFEVRAPSSMFSPSHRRIFTNSSTQDFPHREPPLRIWVIQAWEYTTPLSNKLQPLIRGQAQSQHKINLSLDGYLQTQSPLHLEGYQQTQSPLHLEGYQKPNCTTSSTLRGKGTKQSKGKGLQYLVVSKTTNQFFLTKQ